MTKSTLIILKLTLAALLLAGTSGVRADIFVITNADNPVAQLSLKEVRKVFLGRLHLYPGTEHEPLAIDLPQTSHAYRHFYEKTVGISLPKLKRYRAYYLFSGKGKIPSEAPNSDAVVDAVKRSTYAIGYVETSAENLQGIKILYREE
ncbi:type 2 periplasmic-binding domain-containing protein [Ketobacter alkanivorans]|uniref:Phosphate ABC transporter substrate-binding protein n=1 Tax=Ketobacter alkanivorans TaxID=1917421 RepID=A0A2K9LHU4_9GAMM|nr:hypothetical protein [Ketobacter alkanivorans]AUM11852.1 hypothetical protein Kalk_05180 [Ketobacter alkanivorans]